MPPPDRSRSGKAGNNGEDEEGTGGKATGGRSGTGGKTGTGGKSGTGGATPDAAPEDPADAGVSTPPDAGRKLDAARDFAANPAATFEKLELVLANCVYCHNDATKRLDLQYTDLHGKLVNVVAEKSPAACPTRMAVVPGEPMQSLLYLKVSGTMASTCGVRMPFGKPMITPMELKVVHDWIMAGAPGPK